MKHPATNFFPLFPFSTNESKIRSVSKTVAFPRNERKKDRNCGAKFNEGGISRGNLNRVLNSTRLDTSLPFTARVEDERVVGRGREEIGWTRWWVVLYRCLVGEGSLARPDTSLERGAHNRDLKIDSKVESGHGTFHARSCVSGKSRLR